VVNIPVTYPPEPVNGVFVSGLTTPDRPGITYTYPATLADELEAELGEYIVEPSLFDDARRGDWDSLWRKISRHLEVQVAAVKYLLKTRDFDFFAANFRATDSGAHSLWQGDEHDGGPYLLEIYRRLDEFLGWLMAHLPAETLLLVISDHGAGPVGDRAVLLNRWLAQEGYLAVPSGRPQRVVWQRIAKWIRYHNPPIVRKWLKRLVPKLYERLRAPSGRFLIDWARTRAYADEQLMMIWVNLAGRDPEGIVTPGREYDELVSELKSKLLQLRDPESDLPVLESVCLRDEIYTGPMTRYAPDLVLWPAADPPYEVVRSDLIAREGVLISLEGVTTGLPIRRGNHRQMGLFMAWGQGVGPASSTLEGLRLIDIAPTILYALGAAVPRAMGGRILLEVFDQPIEPTYDESEPESLDTEGWPGREVSVEDDATVLERLRGLGYID
jgi:predicted AlkP superfamily phosphohydrolase/phosphomutase